MAQNQEDIWGHIRFELSRCHVVFKVIEQGSFIYLTCLGRIGKRWEISTQALRLGRIGVQCTHESGYLTLSQKYWRVQGGNISQMNQFVLFICCASWLADTFFFQSSSDKSDWLTRAQQSTQPMRGVIWNRNLFRPIRSHQEGQRVSRALKGKEKNFCPAGTRTRVSQFIQQNIVQNPNYSPVCFLRDC